MSTCFSLMRFCFLQMFRQMSCLLSYIKHLLAIMCRNSQMPKEVVRDYESRLTYSCGFWSVMDWDLARYLDWNYPSIDLYLCRDCGIHQANKYLCKSQTISWKCKWSLIESGSYLNHWEYYSTVERKQDHHLSKYIFPETKQIKKNLHAFRSK